MRTIPDVVLDKIARHRPHLAGIIRNLREQPAEQAPLFEVPLAQMYLAGETRLTARETQYLAQVSWGGPWGGDWMRISEASYATGYSEVWLRQMAQGAKLPALKRGKVWYLRRDSLPQKRGEAEGGQDDVEE